MSENKLETLINFPKGIPGFEECKYFKLIQEEDSLLANLVSTETGEAGFVIFRTQLFFPDYLPNVELAAEEAGLLEIGETDSLEVWSLLTLRQSDMSKTTANLRAPVILNRRTGKGAQFILNDDRYSSRQPLFAELENTDRKEGVGEGAVG